MGHLELPVEKVAEFRVLSKKDPLLLDLLLGLNEGKKFLIAEQNGAGHTKRDANAGWIITEKVTRDAP